MAVPKQLLMKLGIIHLNFEARTAEELQHFLVVFKAKLHCIRHMLKNTISAEAIMCVSVAECEFSLESQMRSPAAIFAHHFYKKLCRGSTTRQECGIYRSMAAMPPQKRARH